MNQAPYPFTRMRRLRQAPWIRELVQETRLHPSDFILPLFVHDENADAAIASLPGVSRHSIASLVEKAKAAKAAGIPAIALFPATNPSLKTPDGTEALNPDNLVCRAIKAVKNAVPEIGIIADVALDPYTSHGHDGLVDDKGQVHNDATMDVLTRQALVLAAAGADVVAPSDMMDGRVGAIRMGLESEGFWGTLILAYTAKYASSFYGPFRDAVGSAVAGGYLDKRGYQMNPANVREAIAEAKLDVAEGADMIMVKPALPYLDVISELAKTTETPVFAYQVSGEYAMIKHAAAAGAFNEQAAMLESLTAIKRAGAKGILTYAALEISNLINGI